MADDPDGMEAQWLVVNRYGLHARPAAVLARIAHTFDAQITFSCDGREADARSILAILSLTASRGTWITVRTRGPQAVGAMRAVGELFGCAFHESDDDLSPGGEPPPPTRAPPAASFRPMPVPTPAPA